MKEHKFFLNDELDLLRQRLVDGGKISNEQWSLLAEKTTLFLEMLRSRLLTKTDKLDYYLDLFKNLLTILFTGWIGLIAVNQTEQVIQLRGLILNLIAVCVLLIILLSLYKDSFIKEMQFKLEYLYGQLDKIYEARLKEVGGREMIFQKIHQTSDTLRSVTQDNHLHTCDSCKSLLSTK